MKDVITVEYDESATTSPEDQPVSSGAAAPGSSSVEDLEQVTQGLADADSTHPEEVGPSQGPCMYVHTPEVCLAWHLEILSLVYV